MKGFGAQDKSKKKKNKKITPSKEQIINQAINFHVQENISEATKLYQYCIDQGFNDHRVFTNYGVILQNLGQSKDAELSYRKAIKIKPDYADAHNNLGIILSNLGFLLKDLGKIEEAELSYQKAIKIKPNYADAHNNLGVLLKARGKLKEAELSYQKAIKIKPDYAAAHYNLANTQKDIGKLQGAFDSYLKVIEINPEFPNIYNPLTEFLKHSNLSNLNKLKLKNILNLLLKRNDISHNELFQAFNFLYSNEVISNLKKFNSGVYKIELLINDKVIINALKKIIFCNPKLEEQLTKARRNICNRIAYKRENIYQSELELIIALGEQCFLNEYIYSSTEEDNLSINIIINKCRNGEVNETNISILSCYFPLYKFLDKIPSLKSFNSSNQSFKELIRLQIIEPLKELDLSKNIKKLGKMNNSISQKVKSQYEENPYPRWRYGNHFENQKISIVQAINNEITPNYVSQKLGSQQIKVLIAGCGTGQQILQAQRYKNTQITAIDLSSSSLAYAQRRINELNIKKVKLIEMDILEVSLLEEQFDIIECGGVLHHMDDPSKGLKALLGVLKKTGFLKLGLYSELARKDIVKARNYIANKKLQANEDNIRDFRENIFSGETSALNSLTKSFDFYTLSSCRDLCFHIEEHRFTINQLQETLKSNELQFLGFLLPQSVKSSYKQYFQEDKMQINLQNWAKYEEKHPTTFSGMYQFWVSKL